MEIFVVRHGETEANKTGKLQGLTDSPLTENGARQASELAGKLSGTRFDVIFSSPLKRALDTAKIIAQEVKTDIQIEENLKEICYGDWEGRKKSDLKSNELWQERTSDKYNFRHPGEYAGSPGESYADIYERVSTFFEGLLDGQYDRVIVVTHLGVLRNLKKYLDECSDDSAVSFTLGHKEILKADPNNRELKASVVRLG